MDTLNLTNGFRRDLITYVSPHLDADSLRWFRDTLSIVNKKLMESEDFQLHVDVFNIYSNFEKFFRECVSEVTAGGILYTLYSCVTQAGLTLDVKRFVELEPIKNLFDFDDFSFEDCDDFEDFDLTINIKTMRVLKGFSQNEDILACGLITLTNLKFYPTK